MVTLIIINKYNEQSQMYLTRTFSDFKLKSKSNKNANKKLPRIDTAYEKMLIFQQKKNY